MIPPRYQTFWRRFWAGFLDSLVFLPLTLIDDFVWSHASAPVTAAWLVVFEFSFIVYTIAFHWQCGQTIGKMICGVRVIDYSENRSLTVRQAILRDLPWLLLLVVSVPRLVSIALQGENPYELDLNLFTGLAAWAGGLWIILEFFTMLFSKKRRALHDLLAGSVVVRGKVRVSKHAA